MADLRFGAEVCVIDLGYMINHSMFQRNGRAGYLLKPEALRSKEKNLLMIKKMHCLNIKVYHAPRLLSRRQRGPNIPYRSFLLNNYHDHEMRTAERSWTRA